MRLPGVQRNFVYISILSVADPVPQDGLVDLLRGRLQVGLEQGVVQYNTVQYSTIQYRNSTVQYNTVQYSTVQHLEH